MLEDEFNHSLHTKNIKRACGIYLRMQANVKYSQEFLDGSLNKIQNVLNQRNNNQIAYGFVDYLDITSQNTEFITPHKFYSHIDEIDDNLKVRGWCFSSINSSNRASFSTS